MDNKIQIIMVIALTFAISLAIANFQNAFAQNQTIQTASSNQSQLPTNMSAASITGQPETILANQTTVPAEQTTIRVNQSTEPVEDTTLLQPLGNQSIQSETPSLSAIENDTTLTTTGPAVTTIVNQTTTPFNQTTIQTENITDLQQQQQPQQQNQTQPQQQNQTQPQLQNQTQPQLQNQTQGPLEELGEAVGNILPS